MRNVSLSSLPSSALWLERLGGVEMILQSGDRIRCERLQVGIVAAERKALNRISLKNFLMCRGVL